VVHALHVSPHGSDPGDRRAPTREASDLLGHSRISQTTDTYVGRKAVSRKAAEVLEIFARAEEREFDVTKIDPADPAAS
jgi:integrase